ncbi:MAG: PKD domain-containing protein, partial [Anaerolineales bacterium]|nr:PKD domain-containing protein [Anaerolineales bacterium]
MANHYRVITFSVITVLFLIIIFAVLNPILNATPEVRGKSPAAPVEQELTEAQEIAQDLALSDPKVQALTTGKRSEVFGVRWVGNHFTPDSRACAENTCYQVEIYNFDQNEAVVAIVDVDNRRVLDVLYQPGVQPGINQRLAELAIEIATTHPDVVRELGFQPLEADMAPVDADLINSVCEEGHVCAGPTFEMGDRILWAIVDLTDEELVGINFTGMNSDPTQTVFYDGVGFCPDPGSHNQGGWSLSYDTTGTDGFRVYDVTYNGVEVATSIKLAEWHVDYGASGFVDTTGCGGAGGGFAIFPFGQTQILDLPGPAGEGPVGFEVVQDFRMSNWGAFCNYRYEQHMQFFDDGRFQVISGAYGRGCGGNALYRPLMRIDLAVAGDPDDSFHRWDGSAWEKFTTEFYFVPYMQSGHGPHLFDPDGNSWMFEDLSGAAYKVKLSSEGQPDDGFHDDDPFVYIVQHHADEGDSDLGVIGNCCNNDHQQGPEQYINGDSIDSENIVFWYVPQYVSDDNPGSYYCWTVLGEPNPETYPCFGGPIFTPTTTRGITAAFSHSGPAGIGETVVFTNTSSGPPPLSYQWDFGDGSGASQAANPTYAYSSEGTFTITLTVTNTTDTDIYTDTIFIGTPAVADFTDSSPKGVGETVVFTNTSTGSPPLFYLWNFGDGSPISTELDPSHAYSASGVFTVTLTASNVINSDKKATPIAIGIAPMTRSRCVSALNHSRSPFAPLVVARRRWRSSSSDCQSASNCAAVSRG